MVRMIGDVHGKFKRYHALIEGVERSIQVGDMGIGFKLRGGTVALPDPPLDWFEEGRHQFIRGNHDNPMECVMHPYWIPDGRLENGVMYVGGGLSIDKEYRIPGLSWWPEEELSIPHMQAMVDKFIERKPRVMVTHDCPESVAVALMNNPVKLDFPSRTRQAFQVMFEFHQPELWIFGHWHISFDRVIEGTRFVCLAELECKEFDI